jgi:hypothetical protein
MKFFSIWFALAYACSPAIAQICPLGQHWVRPHFRNEYFRSDGTRVSSSNVKGHCKTNPAGYDFWLPKLISGRPAGWPHSKEISKDWTEEEIEKVLEALGDLPEELRLQTLKHIFRMSKSGTQKGNPSTSAEGTIVLYDEAFSKKHKLGQVLAHEIAHQFYRDLPEEEKQDYHLVTNWTLEKDEKSGKDLIISQRDKGYVKEDGNESPEEDFANNVEVELFDPDNLRKVTPQAQRWLEKHFRGKLKLRGRK